MERPFDQWLLDRAKQADTTIVGCLHQIISAYCAERTLRPNEEINRVVLACRDASPNTNLANQAFNELEAIFFSQHER
ncbi:hypothetical protein GCM10007874_31970 [Labrys miyagiensis]|uniref:Uncharacterized protein n=1 Tax=Labrys miyagiensis TaxID=346912 RepID=A0ABQ6CJ39_9HYPH|nr:hypothetical protein GCM10007874_31970 [Labrys miyagiensis]